MNNDIVFIILQHIFVMDPIYSYINLRLVSISWKRIMDRIIKDKIQKYLPNAKYNQKYINWFVLMIFVSNKLKLKLLSKEVFTKRNSISLMPCVLVRKDIGIKMNKLAREYLSNVYCTRNTSFIYYILNRIFRYDFSNNKLIDCYTKLMSPLKIYNDKEIGMNELYCFIYPFHHPSTYCEMGKSELIFYRHYAFLQKIQIY